jgi:hypothetical protein
MARVDGLPVHLLERQRVWPAAVRPGRNRRELSARERAKIDRQTAVVHDCQMPVRARQLLAEEVAEHSMFDTPPGGRAAEPRSTSESD